MGKYIKQLTNEDIENFLKENNYELCENIKNNSGEKLPSIERDDKLIFTRCRRILSEDEKEIDKMLAYELMHKYPGFMSLALFATINKYSIDTDIVIFNDFYSNIISADSDREKQVEKLDENYVRFMANKFKNQGYISDYIEDAKKYKEHNNNEIEM